MANSQRLGKEKDKMTERILNLTLEIIYLLTGEDYTVVKKTSGNCVTPNSHHRLSHGRSWGSMVKPPFSSLTPERSNDKKILEVTREIIDLLTGEVSGGFWEIIIQ
ncbi:oocyte zinc finger protein XlCOF29-like [Mantella aurantiaca]